MCNCRGARNVAPRTAPPVRTVAPRTAPVRTVAPRAAPPPAPKPRAVTTAVSQARQMMPNFSRSWRIETPAVRTKSGLVAYNTALWGPSLWRALHTAAEVGDLSKWSAIPVALNGALPCPDCEKHYHQWLVAHPAPSGDRDAVRRWLLDLHNDVNRRSRKALWTLEQVTAAYSDVAAATAALTTAESMVGATAVAAIRATLA